MSVQTTDEARVRLPPKLIPVFLGEADYRGAYGGRGSGKTRSFAKMTAVRGYQWSAQGDEGLIVCARELMNSLDESSFAEIKAAILSEPWLADHYDVGEKYIRTRDRRIEYDFVGLRHNLDSIKSKARIKLFWADEGEPITDTAWQKAIPSVREDDSEIWVTWNPERKSSSTNKRFREDPPGRSKIVEINYRDNPWFPAGLDRKRLEDLEKRPDQYDHIWEGGFKTVAEGAYFAKVLAQAKAQERIDEAFADPLLSIRAYVDIGGSGKNADAMSIWVVQFAGEKINVLDYIEGQGQVLAYYVNLMRKHGWADAEIVLPHDGVNENNVTGKRYADHWADAGFEVRVIPNQGRGAALMRIEAVRRVFSRCVFNAKKCQAGLEALGWYHEKRDDQRNVGLGPDHDWSCFTGDTEVWTRTGKQRIMDLHYGEVLTPCGFKPFKRLGITGKSAPLVEVRFTDGHTVRCTPEHLFLTESGWKSAEYLTSNTPIQSSLTRSRSISMAASTAFGRATDISLVAARSCIATFGRWLSARSRLGAISTTRTVFTPITRWTTSNACLQASTLASAGANTAHTVRFTSLPTPEIVRRSGIAQTKGAFGTDATPSAARAGRSGSERIGPASSVASRSMRWFARAVTLSGFAPRSARSIRTERASFRTSGRPTIASVKRLSERADVWCIQVDDGQWFTLANGAVVHNSHGSDSFGLMAIDYEAPVKNAPALAIPRFGVV